MGVIQPKYMNLLTQTEYLIVLVNSIQPQIFTIDPGKTLIFAGIVLDLPQLQMMTDLITAIKFLIHIIMFRSIIM
jgi:hypothetical protein